ncbi:MAG: hypothetical protein ACLRP7_00705, partial [Christensenellales bacterium]
PLCLGVCLPKHLLPVLPPGVSGPGGGDWDRRVRRICASGSCTRQAGRTEELLARHLGGAI